MFNCHLDTSPEDPAELILRQIVHFQEPRTHWLGLRYSLGGESSLRLVFVPKDTGFLTTTKTRVTVNLGCHMHRMAVWTHDIIP